MSAPKTIAKEVINSLPEDSSYEEIIRALAFDKMIQRGLEDVKKRKVLSHKEMGQQIAQW
jgi:hypothetical protein